MTERVEWEYETLRAPRGATKHETSDPKDELNELGANGWELVGTASYSGGGTKYYLLKRPRDPAANERRETAGKRDVDGTREAAGDIDG